jgi:hypothetical protein
MRKSTFSNTHLTIGVRIFKHGMHGFNTRDDKNLEQHTMKMPYYEWDEHMPGDDIIFLSDYKNKSQNTALMNQEAQKIRAIQKICIDEERLAHQVKVGNVVRKFTAESIVKVNSNQILAYVKWVCAMGMRPACFSGKSKSLICFDVFSQFYFQTF